MDLALWNSTVGTAGVTQVLPCSPDHKVEYTGTLLSLLVLKVLTCFTFNVYWSHVQVYNMFDSVP